MAEKIEKWDKKVICVYFLRRNEFFNVFFLRIYQMSEQLIEREKNNFSWFFSVASNTIRIVEKKKI